MKNIYLFISFVLISCGQSINLNNLDLPLNTSKDPMTLDIAVEEYSYSFFEKECSTDQSATTLEEICKILLDDKKNKNCALEQRDILHQNECS